MTGFFWTDLLRGLLVAGTLFLVFWAQRYWFNRAWRFTARVPHRSLRMVLRAAWFAALATVTGPLVMWMLGLRSRLALALVVLWLAAAMFSWLGVRAVHGAERMWHWLRPQLALLATKVRARRALVDLRLARSRRPAPAHDFEILQNPSRRYLFQTTAVAVGIAPFAVSLYGYFGERLRFVVERVEVPIPDLPAALDGLRIVQLSDIHLSSYLPREEARRAVAMANELGAHLAVVTGDFITGHTDPLEDCVEELAALRAPLGVWGCNGNHEIYAREEARAAQLFQQAGMRLLRQRSAEVLHNGQALNLIGVDYQRSRAVDGPPKPMLEGVEPLVRRDVPNILLSHNPNAFPRAAELGIELTLAGHTHGGQVQVEILDHHLSPARFMSDFVAGLYHRPLGPAGAQQIEQGQRRTAFAYVNRGIGTVGTPVRFGAPPEITLLTLRRV